MFNAAFFLLLNHSLTQEQIQDLQDLKVTEIIDLNTGK